MSNGMSLKSQSSSKSSHDPQCTCETIGKDHTKSESSSEESQQIEEDEKIKKSLWNTILEESQELRAPYDEWLKERQEVDTENIDSPTEYLSHKIFPILLPAMEQICQQAKSLDVLAVQKCRFNGLDSLAEYLWNRNPQCPIRSEGWLDVFDIPQFKLSMRLKPRPIFPKSWLWSTTEAASHIQRYVRGWLVRKREDVQEMRQFWKVIRTGDESFDHSKDNDKESVLNICERYKLLAKKRERPF